MTGIGMVLKNQGPRDLAAGIVFSGIPSSTLYRRHV